MTAANGYRSVESTIMKHSVVRRWTGGRVSTSYLQHKRFRSEMKCGFWYRGTAVACDIETIKAIHVYMNLTRPASVEFFIYTPSPRVL